MAQKITFAFFLIALIMFATAKPLAHGQVGGLLGLLNNFLGPILSPRLLAGSPVTVSNIPQPALNVLPHLVQGLKIHGRICCTKNGTCPATGGQALSRALVNLNCTSNQFSSGSLVIGQNRTDINGYFNFTVANILNTVPNLLVSPLLPCKITVQLDQAVCPALDLVDGILAGVLGPLRLILDSVLGLILCLTVH